MYTLRKKVTTIKGRAPKHAVMKSVWKTCRQIVAGNQDESAPKYTPL